MLKKYKDVGLAIDTNLWTLKDRLTVILAIVTGNGFTINHGTTSIDEEILSDKEVKDGDGTDSAG